MNIFDSETALAWHYDRIANDYAKVDNQTDRILSRVNDLSSDSAVLDIGCATGNLTFRLPHLKSLRKVIGVDVSEKATRIAQDHANKLGLNNIEFRRGSASQLPCLDQEFDIALSNMVFHLISDHRQALKETLRVLKPGGRAVLRFLSGGEVLPEWVQMVNTAWCQVLPNKKTPRLFYEISTSELKTYLAELGVNKFEIVHNHDVIKTYKQGTSALLDFMRLVADFWKWDLAPAVYEKIDQLIIDQLERVMEQKGLFGITIDMLLVDFTKSRNF